jgi:hypothetical protein
MQPGIIDRSGYGEYIRVFFKAINHLLEKEWSRAINVSIVIEKIYVSPFYPFIAFISARCSANIFR